MFDSNTLTEKFRLSIVFQGLSSIFKRKNNNKRINCFQLLYLIQSTTKEIKFNENRLNTAKGAPPLTLYINEKTTTPSAKIPKLILTICSL